MNTQGTQHSAADVCLIDSHTFQAFLAVMRGILFYLHHTRGGQHSAIFIPVTALPTILYVLVSWRKNLTTVHILIWSHFSLCFETSSITAHTHKVLAVNYSIERYLLEMIGYCEDVNMNSSEIHICVWQMFQTLFHV